MSDKACVICGYEPEYHRPGQRCPGRDGASTYTPRVDDAASVETFPSGAVRDNRIGKGRYDLLPPRAVDLVSKHFEAGARKYGDRNWEKGQPVSRYLDSGLRHAFRALKGDTDEDHLVAAAWNLLAAIETRERARAGRLPLDLNDV